MTGLRDFVNSLVNKKADDIRKDILANSDSKLVTKANMFIVKADSGMSATAKQIGDIELASGDFVFDIDTPRLWLVKSNGTNKYITLK